MIVSPLMLWKKFDLTQELHAAARETGASEAGFPVWDVYFDGHLLDDGERVRVFARFSRPKGGEKVPAIVLLPDACEDGKDLSDYFVSRGYAVIVPDYCGKRVANAGEESGVCDAKERAEENETQSTEENAMRYTRYPSAVSYAEYENADTLDRLTGNSAEESCWAEWAYVALYAAEYLKSREDVAKIAVAGVRLGGEIAWMTLLSPDISCGVAINAIGWRSHLSSPKFGGDPLDSTGEDAEAVRAFIAGVEAESYAPFVHCPVLMCCATEDSFFDCDRAYDTFVRLGNADGSAIVYSSDSGGCIDPSALVSLDLFFERHLKGRQIFIPKPVDLTVSEGANGAIEIRAQADEDALVKNISVYYAEGRSGQKSSRRAWQKIKRSLETEIKGNRVECVCQPFAGAEYAFCYASAEFINGFKTVSPVIGKKLSEKSASAVRSRVISSGEKEDFSVADCKNNSVGGIFLEKEIMPETASGYGGIAGVCSPAGIRTYRIGSPRFCSEEGAALKADAYSREDTSVKITVETEEDDGAYSAAFAIKGGGKWKRLILRAEEFKKQTTGEPLKSFCSGVALVVRSEEGKEPVLITNLLWL